MATRITFTPIRRLPGSSMNWASSTTRKSIAVTRETRIGLRTAGSTAKCCLFSIGCWCFSRITEERKPNESWQGILLRVAELRAPTQKRWAGPMRFQWMENQIRKRQARATRENFVREMVRMSWRRQIRTPERMAKRLKKMATPVNQFMSTKYLSEAWLGGMVVLPRRVRSVETTMTSTTQARAANLGAAVRRRVPGCG